MKQAPMGTIDIDPNKEYYDWKLGEGFNDTLGDNSIADKLLAEGKL